jgi:hypothetical protein
VCDKRAVVCLWRGRAGGEAGREENESRTMQKEKGQYIHNILDSIKSCQTSVKICISEALSCLSIVTPWRPLGSNVGGVGSAVSFSLSGSLDLSVRRFVSCVVYLVISVICDCAAVVAECQRDALQSSELVGAIRGVMRAHPRRTWAHVQCKAAYPDAIAKRKRAMQTLRKPRS